MLIWWLFCYFFKLYLSQFRHRQLTAYVVVLFLASARPCLKNTGIKKMYGICHSKKVPNRPLFYLAQYFANLCSFYPTFYGLQSFSRGFSIYLFWLFFLFSNSNGSSLRIQRKNHENLPFSSGYSLCLIYKSDGVKHIKFLTF